MKIKIRKSFFVREIFEFRYRHNQKERRSFLAEWMKKERDKIFNGGTACECVESSLSC